MGRQGIHGVPAEDLRDLHRRIPRILRSDGVLRDARHDAKWIGILFVLFTLVVYAFIGVLSRTTRSRPYSRRGRTYRGFTGMATAADWMSGASSCDGRRIFMSGHRTWPSSWAGPRYILIATLIAPYCVSSAATPCRTSSALATRQADALCAIVVLGGPRSSPT